MNLSWLIQFLLPVFLLEILKGCNLATAIPKQQKKSTAVHFPHVT